MHKQSVIMGMIMVACLLLVTTLTWANCEQQDLEGTWTAQVWGAGNSDRQCWDQCTLTIGPDGVIAPEGTLTECLDATTTQVTGGQLTMSPDCVIAGYIYTSQGTVCVENGAILQDGLVFGRPEN